MALLKWPFSSPLHEILVKSSLQFSSISSLMQHEFHLIDFKLLLIAHVVLKTRSSQKLVPWLIGAISLIGVGMKHQQLSLHYLQSVFHLEWEQRQMFISSN